MPSVLWHDRDELGAERCSLARVPGGFELRGEAVVPLAGAPALVSYRVEADERWHTRFVDAAVSLPGSERRLQLVADGAGGWRDDERRRDELDGCLDVDLAVTPATNTLPIRRLCLAPGAEASIDVAWVRFPELEVARAGQRYRRSGERSYAYRSGDYAAELLVDGDGLVRDYERVWEAVAGSREPPLAGAPAPRVAVGAAALVLDVAGRVLLIRENYGARRFGLPAGAIDPGERPEEAAVREALEETGLAVVPERLVGVYGFRDALGELHMTVYLCRVAGGEPAVPASGEIATVGWYDPVALPEPLTNAAPLAIADALAGAYGSVRLGLPRTR